MMSAHSDESSSSSDESDFDGEESWDESGYAMHSMANAIQSEFIRRLPKSKPNMSELVQRQGSAFRKLGAFNGPKQPPMTQIEENLYVVIDDDVTERSPDKNNGGNSLWTHSKLASTDLPGNALVLFCGCVQMTAQELRDLDFTRCIRALCSRDDKHFALLKIRAEQFTLEECDSRQNGDEESTDTSDEEENRRRKKRFSPRRMGKKESLSSGDGNGEKQGFKKSLFSCMKCTSSEYLLFEHNNSINLKGYEAMKKRKRSYVIEYKRVIFCGSNMAGAPNNLLCWIYHADKDKYTTVEFYAVECDDLQHAKLLARSLGKQIAAASGR